MNKILVAVDKSNQSVKAASIGIEIASKMNADIAFVYVIDATLAMGNIDAGITPEQAKIVLIKEAEETLDELVGQHKNDLSIHRFMPEGNPSEEILSSALSWSADLIVMGTHGRHGLKHLLMGSIAEDVLRHTPIPVLVVPLKLQTD